MECITAELIPDPADSGLCEGRRGGVGVDEREVDATCEVGEGEGALVW